MAVEIAVGGPDSDSDVEERLTDAIYRVLTSCGSTCPYPSPVDVSSPLTQQPILEGLIDLTQYKLDVADYMADNAPTHSARPTPPGPKTKGQNLALAEGTRTPSVGTATATTTTHQNRKSVARERLEQQKAAADSLAARAKAIARAVYAQSQKVEQTVTDNKGTTRTTVKVEMALVTDNLSRSATLYKDLVTEFSGVYQIEEPLIYAIMEQESAFNPQATSYVPAYGLMQLVPKSGGAHAYRYVYKKEWIPTQSYLYDPRNNIELGTAYLRVLSNQFASITDQNCRRLCVIASYNTGAGNVSRAFTGTTKLANALGLINNYNYEGLYNHLSTKLNTSEARNYVVSVSRRREKYLK